MTLDNGAFKIHEFEIGKNKYFYAAIYGNMIVLDITEDGVMEKFKTALCKKYDIPKDKVGGIIIDYDAEWNDDKKNIFEEELPLPIEELTGINYTNVVKFAVNIKNPLVAEIYLKLLDYIVLHKISPEDLNNFIVTHGVVEICNKIKDGKI